MSQQRKNFLLGKAVQAKRAKMAAPMAPSIAELTIIWLAGDDGVAIPPARVPEGPVLVERGLLVGVRVDVPDPVVATEGREVVVVTTVLLVPPEVVVLLRQLLSEVSSGTGLDCEVTPLESVNASPRFAGVVRLQNHE